MARLAALGVALRRREAHSLSLQLGRCLRRLVFKGPPPHPTQEPSTMPSALWAAWPGWRSAARCVPASGPGVVRRGRRGRRSLAGSAGRPC